MLLKNVSLAFGRFFVTIALSELSKYPPIDFFKELAWIIYVMRESFMGTIAQRQFENHLSLRTCLLRLRLLSLIIVTYLPNYVLPNCSV